MRLLKKGGRGTIWITYFASSLTNPHFCWISNVSPLPTKIFPSTPTENTHTHTTRTLNSSKEVLFFLLSNPIKIPLAQRKRNKHTDQPSKSLQNKLVTFQASVLELSLTHLPFHHFTLSSALSPSPYTLNLSSTDSLEKSSTVTNSFPPPLFIPLQIYIYPLSFFSKGFLNANPDFQIQ